MEYLFIDYDNFNVELEATTLRSAIREARERFCIKGRIAKSSHSGTQLEYRVVGTRYKFVLVES